MKPIRGCIATLICVFNLCSHHLEKQNWGARVTALNCTCATPALLQPTHRRDTPVWCLRHVATATACSHWCHMTFPTSLSLMCVCTHAGGDCGGACVQVCAATAGAGDAMHAHGAEAQATCQCVLQPDGHIPTPLPGRAEAKADAGRKHRCRTAPPQTNRHGVKSWHVQASAPDGPSMARGAHTACASQHVTQHPPEQQPVHEKHNRLRRQRVLQKHAVFRGNVEAVVVRARAKESCNTPNVVYTGSSV